MKLRRRSKGNRRRLSLGQRVRAALTPEPRQPSGARGKGGPTSRGRSGRGLARLALSVFAWLLPVAVAIVAFASPLLGVRAYQYVMQTGHFFVREVLISGNHHLDYDRIRELAGIEPGTHVLRVDTARMEQRLERDPWVAWADVERELPDRLLIRLVEREPAAYVALGEMVVADLSGEPFAPMQAGVELDLPIVTGLAPESFGAGAGSTGKSDVRAAVNVSRLYESLGFAERWPISEVRVEADGGLTLVLSDLGTEAYLGAGPYREKLYRLEWILESLRQQGKSADYVLLDNDTQGRDTGHVIVKSDAAPTREELARQAADRAKQALEAMAEQRPAEGEGAAGADAGSEAETQPDDAGRE